MRSSRQARKAILRHNDVFINNLPMLSLVTDKPKHAKRTHCMRAGCACTRLVAAALCSLPRRVALFDGVGLLIGGAHVLGYPQVEMTCEQVADICPAKCDDVVHPVSLLGRRTGCSRCPGYQVQQDFVPVSWLVYWVATGHHFQIADDSARSIDAGCSHNQQRGRFVPCVAGRKIFGQRCCLMNIPGS